jgi:threonine/homoserine/homoserine lactone efflux protein
MLSFVDGLLAGFGIAIPVGAVSVLITTIGMRSGFRAGFAAGAGAATADLIYATAASVGGTALVLMLQPVALWLRIAGGAALIAFAGFGLWKGLGGTDSTSLSPDRVGAWRTYAQLLGITLINPLTVVYFAALVLGRSTGAAAAPGGRLLFVLGATAGSLSWQSFLAVLGSIMRNRLSPRFRVRAALAGNLIVGLLGIRILILALR